MAEWLGSIVFTHARAAAVDLQAMDRAHRLGQTKVVNVYRHDNIGFGESSDTNEIWFVVQVDHSWNTGGEDHESPRI